MSRSAEPRSRHARSTADSVLVHDMKNMGFRLNLLLQNLEEHYGDPDFKRSVVELLHSTVDKVESIIGRYSAHQDAILIKVSLDLNDLLNEVVTRTLSSTPLRVSNPRNVRVVQHFERVPPVWGDPFYLRDAFANLLVNGVEAAAVAGSRVDIRTSVLQTRRRRWCVVEISDDGPGMSPEFLSERLFRAFQSTKEQGVGLGLYTASQVFKLHRGEIHVESAPGAGATVRVLLPAGRGAAA